MSVGASISPAPSPWQIGQQGVYIVRLRDLVLNTPPDLTGATISGKFGPVALVGDVVGNLLADHSFESGSLASVQLNWLLVTPGEWSLDTGIHQGGSASLKCTRTNLGPNSWNGAVQPKATNIQPVIPGATYSGSAWVRQTAGVKQTHVKVEWYQIDGVTSSAIRSLDIIQTGTDGVLPWTKYSASWVAPADAYFADVACNAGWWDGSHGINAQSWFDDIVLVPGSSLAGAFSLIDAPNAVFRWTAGVADAPTTAGRYGLQFKATGTPGGTVEVDPYAIDVKAAL